ncbi:MAG: glutaredoxin [Candidatus Lokiarchaeota archaeon]|nr:glutaredoxin [Candidatus Lokiarchaeota archaeon]
MNHILKNLLLLKIYNHILLMRLSKSHNRWRENTMLDYVEYTKEEGNEYNHDIVVYALSTCGFCRRGLAFLRENNIPFNFVYVDKLPFDLKMKIKNDLKEKFGKRVVFPYLVYDDKDLLVGFTKDEWKAKLLG